MAITFTITVILDPETGELSVSQQMQQVPAGETAKIEWRAGSSELTITYIGFYQPTATQEAPPVSPTTTPTQVGDHWECEVTNTYAHEFADHFYYTVYAENEGVTYCTDPEIENEPNG